MQGILFWKTPHIVASNVIRDSENRSENGDVAVTGGTYTQKVWILQKIC